MQRLLKATKGSDMSSMIFHEPKTPRMLDEENGGVSGGWADVGQRVQIFSYQKNKV